MPNNNQTNHINNETLNNENDTINLKNEVDESKYSVADDDPILGASAKQNSDQKTHVINENREPLSASETVILPGAPNNLNDDIDTSGLDVFVTDFSQPLYDKKPRVDTTPRSYDNPVVKDSIQPVLNKQKEEQKKKQRKIIIAIICICAAVILALVFVFMGLMGKLGQGNNTNANQNAETEIIVSGDEGEVVEGKATRQMNIEIEAEGWDKGDLPYLIKMTGKPDGTYQEQTRIYQVSPKEGFTTDIECGKWTIQSLGSPITDQGVIFTDINGEVEIKNVDSVPYEIKIKAFPKAKGSVTYQELLMIKNYYLDEDFNKSQIDSLVEKAMKYYDVSEKDDGKNIATNTPDDNKNANANQNTANQNTTPDHENGSANQNTSTGNNGNSNSATNTAPGGNDNENYGGGNENTTSPIPPDENSNQSGGNTGGNNENTSGSSDSGSGNQNAGSGNSGGDNGSGSGGQQPDVSGDLGEIGTGNSE